jgi:TetR/AcrR family transcriptional repressor of nem operon
MKVSKIQVDENRRAILAAAGKLFRARGFDGVSIAEVMQAAGLTHGAFYGYFRSKDELVAATLSELTASTRKPGPYAEETAKYLSTTHRDDCVGGCPVAALGSETIRQSTPVRAAMTGGIERMVARLAQTAPGETEDARRRAALSACAAMVGALILSRAVDDPALSEALLAATRERIASG